MRRFSANYVYTNAGLPIRNGVIGVNDEGVIVEIIDHKGQEKEYAHTEFRNGIIVPGFVNAHCHTELSMLKEQVTPKTGLADFVNQIRNSRLRGLNADENSICNALDEIRRTGTVALADICNTTHSYTAKQQSQIGFVNFVEVLGLDNEKAQQVMDRAMDTKRKLSQLLGSKNFLTPHSVYALSTKLWEQLAESLTRNEIISIHFAESKAEEQFTQSLSGPIAQNYKDWDLPFYDVPKGRPIDIVRQYLPKEAKILFIHNTFLTREQARELNTYFSNAYFVLCPTSNIYIENTLPNIIMLNELGLRIALGTDSLASSHTLSIFEQLREILTSFSELNFAEVLCWATINGAKALGLDSDIGTIELGKSPGLNLITPFDFESGTIRDDSRVVRLA
ncbi:MAG: amidohydrolase family protein [Tenuifilaceae bacterium]|nr:amidohydrolase family protein [Tenuifilaceae bacterium]